MKGNINKVIVLVRLEGSDQIYQAITDKPTEFFIANTLAGMTEGEIKLIPAKGISFQKGATS
ncbi:hypothetical protein [Serratia fonticola]|uniref:hypothetical protein n=1 Tax=Serratia fonticola TaxID=47917 RepID=UPI001377EB1E|nr:hypothetical protein [Serratia fonticola]NCG53703.1 hypothetical protein [Serratia fonticola]